MRAIHSAIFVSRQIAIDQPEPDCAVRVNRNFPCGNHWRRRKFFLLFEASDPAECHRGTLGLNPDVMVSVLGDSNDHPYRTAILLFDESELMALRNGQIIIETHPQTAYVVFEN